MKIKKKFQDSVIGWLEKKYPGVRDIVNLLDNVRERVDTQYIKGLTELEDLTKADKEEMKDILKESGITIERPEEDGNNLYPKLDSEDNIDKPKENGEKSDVGDEKSTEIFKQDDGKWRPVVLTLGLVYKLQKIILPSMGPKIQQP